MRIAVFGRNITPVFYDSLKRLFTILHLHGVEVTVYRPFLEYMRSEINFDPKTITDFSNHKELRNVDFFFSIGGDGAFLEAISLVRDSGIPMVGINSGRLGFLADVAQQELESALDRFFAEQTRAFRPFRLLNKNLNHSFPVVQKYVLPDTYRKAFRIRLR